MSLTLADGTIAILLAILTGVIVQWIAEKLPLTSRRIAVAVGLLAACVVAGAYVKVQQVPTTVASGKTQPQPDSELAGATRGATGQAKYEGGSGEAVLKRPEVSLAQITRAAALDPDRDQGLGTPGCTESVETFENALALLGLLNRKWVDGSYGTATVAAVERFQRQIGDHADGVPGPLQLKSLAIRSGAFEPAP